MAGRGRHVCDHSTAVEASPATPWFLPLLEDDAGPASAAQLTSDGVDGELPEIAEPSQVVHPRADVVGQLQVLYAEKLELHAALGVSSPDEIAALATRLHGEDLQRSRQMSQELERLRADRDLLYGTLERDCAPDVIALVTDLRANLARLLADSRHRLGLRMKELEELGKRSRC
jgi:hypothetical protein